ncbi:uncharacterized protein RCO7_14063 [Rhynchosporium graminicola]|uniref:Uncharacterized protein n=1 Tax=Rhynchosporium graminicola TaxID=2792576 RepID=A0A1E1LM38_9HELO|nr:uncharacterized protein RCO7_14063 [Rhynchosporium commune]
MSSIEAQECGSKPAVQRDLAVPLFRPTSNYAPAGANVTSSSSDQQQ